MEREHLSSLIVMAIIGREGAPGRRGTASGYDLFARSFLDKSVSRKSLSLAFFAFVFFSVSFFCSFRFSHFFSSLLFFCLFLPCSYSSSLSPFLLFPPSLLHHLPPPPEVRSREVQSRSQRAARRCLGAPGTRRLQAALHQEDGGTGGASA